MGSRGRYAADLVASAAQAAASADAGNRAAHTIALDEPSATAPGAGAPAPAAAAAAPAVGTGMVGGAGPRASPVTPLGRSTPGAGLRGE